MRLRALTPLTLNTEVKMRTRRLMTMMRGGTRKGLLFATGGKDMQLIVRPGLLFKKRVNLFTWVRKARIAPISFMQSQNPALGFRSRRMSLKREGRVKVAMVMVIPRKKSVTGNTRNTSRQMPKACRSSKRRSWTINQNQENINLAYFAKPIHSGP